MLNELEKITIIGPGLIGGSIGLALKRANFSGRIVGVGRRKSSLEQAIERGAIDESTLDISKGVEGSDLVILCVGVSSIASVGKEAVKGMRQGSLLTDVGSAKSCLISELAPVIPPNIFYVSSHPLAGSERRGVQYARADLFDGSVCILVPTEPLPESTPDDESDTSTTAIGYRDCVSKISDFWRALGCQTIPLMSVQRHDHVMALVSHLPHLVAAALVNSTTAESINYAAKGFGDTTRIASGDPELWRDICASNREEIVNALSAFSQNIQNFINVLKSGNDDEVLAILKEAKARRQKWEDEKKGENKWTTRGHGV